MQNQEKRTALVTGGLRGIGKAIVEKLSKRGDSLFVFDIAPVDDERVKEIQALGVKYFQVDVASLESVKNGFNQVNKILEQEKLNLDL